MKKSDFLVVRFFPWLSLMAEGIPAFISVCLFKTNNRDVTLFYLYMFILMFGLAFLVWFCYIFNPCFKRFKFPFLGFIFTVMIHAMDILSTFFNGLSWSFNFNPKLVNEATETADFIFSMDIAGWLIIFESIVGKLLFCLVFSLNFALMILSFGKMKKVGKDKKYYLGDMIKSFMARSKLFIQSIFYFPYLLIIGKKMKIRGMFPMPWEIIFFTSFCMFFISGIGHVSIIFVVINNILIILKEAKMFSNEMLFDINLSIFGLLTILSSFLYRCLILLPGILLSFYRLYQKRIGLRYRVISGNDVFIKD